MTFEDRNDGIYVQTTTGMEPVLGAHVNRDTGEHFIIVRPRCGKQFHPCDKSDVDDYRDALDEQ